jgi:hypothetical protein
MTKWGGWVLAVAVAVTALFLLGRAGEQAGRDAERVRIAEEQETIAVAFARQQTVAVAKARGRTDSLERALKRKRVTMLARSDSVVDSTQQVLRDSAATVPQLRGALVVAVSTIDRLSAEFREYLAQDSVVHYSWTVERDAVDSALIGMNKAMLAKDGVILALKKASECRVLFFKCPTRSQTAIGTALLIGGITLARD